MIWTAAQIIIRFGWLRSSQDFQSDDHSDVECLMQSDL